MLIFLIVLFAACLGGFLYRIRGGWPDIPRPIEQMLFCAPIIPLSWHAPPLFIGIAFVLSVIACLKGHGNTMDLGHAPTAENEWYENIFGLYRLREKLGNYGYELLAHSFGGFLMTAPLILTLSPMFWVGALKGPAYAIGWALDGKIKIEFGQFTIKKHTEIGEFLTGALIYVCFVAYALFLMEGVNV